MTATKIADIDVTSSDEGFYNYYITGLAILPGGRLIIVDHLNDKVKLVQSQSGRLEDELEVASYPYGVVVIDSDRVAVTLPFEKQVVFLELRESMVKGAEIAVSGECYGVSCHQGKLLVTFVDPPRLEILDFHGEKIRRIEHASDGSRLFVRPLYVCVSEDGETIYVSDCHGGTVTRISWEGAVKSVYMDEALEGPMQICTNDHGNVFVGGFFSSDVHMITADCKKLAVILTQADGLIGDVYSMAYCRETNRLFVGMRGVDRVKVYQLT